MAEASRSQVTITLGSTGGKEGRAYDGWCILESPPATGSKRSVKDRLGSNVDSLMHENPLNNKRQRGDRNKLHLSSNGVNAKGKRIGKDDLRFKIMQKSMSFRAQTNDLLNGMDLREKLSRTVKHAETSVDMQKPRPETKETNPWGQLPSRRSAEDSPQINLPRNSYSAWSLDQLKQRYPDGIFGSTGSLSPQMNVPKLQKRPIIQKYDDGDEQPTVDSLLHSLGLGKYAIYFKAEEVDMAALKQMGEHDLKELGIPMATSIANYHFTRFLHFLACPLKCSAMSLLPLQRTSAICLGAFVVGSALLHLKPVIWLFMLHYVMKMSLTTV
ncbi:hypothetical protein CK203_017059 [Vitis vinifera]|uniref:SAM domain-containing protein n=1 Tax=Vitis vinifera TaxID=29760 RepID=A0A438JNC1_VITVI|nr:hypothetical protein CK203_017059 [Vitis vinifera]